MMRLGVFLNGFPTFIIIILFKTGQIQGDYR